MSDTPTIKAMGRYFRLTPEQEVLRQAYQARLTEDADADDNVYVLLTNRVKIDMVIKILQDVLPTETIITQDEYRRVLSTLIDWRDLSFACMADDEDIAGEDGS